MSPLKQFFILPIIAGLLLGFGLSFYIEAKYLYRDMEKYNQSHGGTDKIPQDVINRVWILPSILSAGGFVFIVLSVRGIYNDTLRHKALKE